MSSLDLCRRVCLLGGPPTVEERLMAETQRMGRPSNSRGSNHLAYPARSRLRHSFPPPPPSPIHPRFLLLHIQCLHHRFTVPSNRTHIRRARLNLRQAHVFRFRRGKFHTKIRTATLTPCDLNITCTCVGVIPLTNPSQRSSARRHIMSYSPVKLLRTSRRVAASKLYFPDTNVAL